jgi:hypothetical protein
MKYYGIQNEVKAYINRLQDENGIFVSTATVKTINDRVESLKRSGDWSRFSLGFNDVDGDAYLARAGVTDPLGRCEVLWFTRGIKALNVWNNFTGWLLRSYQNIGTGNTVYSIGGFGNYNGTMQNSPTWGLDGIAFQRSLEKYILMNNSFTAFNVGTRSFTVGAVAKDTNNSSTDSTGRTLIAKANNINLDSNRWKLTARNMGYNGVMFRTSDNIIPSANIISTLWNGNFRIIQAQAINNNYSMDVNTLNTRTGVNSTHNINSADNVTIGNWWGTGGSFDGTISLAYIINDINVYTRLPALIKSTVGFGLGLP